MDYLSSRYLRPLVWGFSLCSAQVVAAESAGNQVSLHQRLHCLPTLSFFCSNIHIGCAGQSELKTWPFSITMDGDKGQMVAAGKQPALDIPVRVGDIVRADDLESLILFLHPTKDYVKVSTSGKFNFRHYTPRGPLMTYGWCSAQDTVSEKSEESD